MRIIVFFANDRLVWGGLAILVMWMIASQLYSTNKRAEVSHLLTEEAREAEALRKEALDAEETTTDVKRTVKGQGQIGTTRTNGSSARR